MKTPLDEMFTTNAEDRARHARRRRFWLKLGLALIFLAALMLFAFLTSGCVTMRPVSPETMERMNSASAEMRTATRAVVWEPTR